MRKWIRCSGWTLVVVLIGLGCSQDGPATSPTPVVTSAALAPMPTSTVGPRARSTRVATRPAAAGAMTPFALGGGRVHPAATMTVPRASHSATLLADGEVLIAGGCTLDSCELGADGATAELYDPAADAFAPTGRMRSPRVGHAATRLPGGEVLIAGGWGLDGVLSSAELYDPERGAFAPAGDMTARRAASTATALPDGRVLISGGFDGGRDLAGAEIYDPRTGTFTPTGAMGTPRSAHVSALLADGRVLVAGGRSGEGRVLGSAEVYDPVAKSFTPVGDMAVVRHKHAAASLPDGRVLIVGGSDARDSAGRHRSAETYDPVSGRFTPVADMHAERFKLPDAVAVLGSGEVLVAGGGDRAEVFDPHTDAFRQVAGDLGGEWSFATVTALPDGRALVAGGYDAGIRLTAATGLYDPGRVGGSHRPTEHP